MTWAVARIVCKSPVSYHRRVYPLWNILMEDYAEEIIVDVLKRLLC